MKSYLRILSFGKPYNTDIPKFFIFAFFATVFGLLNFTLLIPLLEVLFNPEPQQTAVTVTSFPEFYVGVDYLTDVFNYFFDSVLREKGKKSALLFVCGVIICSVLMSNIFRYFASRAMIKIKSRVIKNIRESVFHKLVDFELGFFTNEKKGDMLSRITNDVQEIETTVVDTFTVILRDPINIICYFAALFMISAELTQFVLLYLPISFIMLAEFIKRLKKSATMSQSYLGEIVGLVDEAMSGIRVVKGFNAEGFVKGKFDNINDNYSRVYRSIANKRDIASPLSEFLGVTLVTGMLLYGGLLILDNESDLKSTEFLPFLFILIQILVPIKAISNSFSHIQRGLVAGERIFSLLDRKVKITEDPQPVEITEFKDKITFENVSFAYESDMVLKDINLTVEKGKTIALVGPSGGGKSTTADLLPRFYDPIAGQICIDGIPVHKATFASLRKLMGIVSQESILFNDTIFSNIAFGMPDARMEDVERAARIANAHEFIEKTENGYQTVIGERGMKLSGGQRQRLNIARAVFKNPPILILDEATSALDNESEKLVQHALTNLMKNRTSIVIAHRLSTIQNADEIIVIERGRIVERGTHDTLISKGGLYKKLHLSSH
jgi:ATP-binding cassette, subfamily B, bacterial MsbA